MRKAILTTAAVMALMGCASGPPPPRPNTPTPTSVTKDEPGGDAPDPHKAALIRLLGQPYGRRSDKFKTLDAAFPDVGNWRRVRFWGYPTRAAFRYGNDHHAVGVLVYRPSEPHDTPRACLERFLEDAGKLAEKFGVEISKPAWETGQHHPRAVVLGETPQRAEGTTKARTRFSRQRLLRRLKRRKVARDMPLVLLDGRFSTLTRNDRYVGAVVAYHSWPGTCLIQGLAVETGDQEDIARAVVERWVREGAPALSWRESVHERPPFKNR